MPRHKINWSPSEEDQVFEQVSKHPGLKWNRMWPHCQQVLPSERRKQFNSCSTISNVTKNYRAWLNSKDRLNKVETPPPDVRISEPDIPHLIVIERPVKLEPDYGAIPTSTLARILLERLALMDQFDKRFTEMEAMIQAKKLAERTHDVRLGPLPPPEPPKEQRIRIAIVGPLDSQAAEIEGRCANTPKPVRLKFFDKDQQRQSPDGIFDYAIVTDHCNHAWWDKMKAVLPADRVFFVNSGIQSVVQKIYDVCSRPS